MFADLATWLLACLLLGACLPRLALPSAPALAANTGALSPQIPLRAPEFPQQKLHHDRYTFDVLFDYAAHRLDVEQQITYVNRRSEPLAELLLVVEPNRYAGAFDLHTLATGEPATPATDWTLRGARLALKLAPSLPPGAAVQLHLAYTLRLPARAGYFGYTARQANLGDWYPFVPPLDAGGEWLAHAPAAVGEHTIYPLADYVMALSGPDLAALRIAAPAAGQRTGAGLRFELPKARNFAWSASPDYELATRRVNGVTVAAFWFGEHAAAGQAALDATAQALSLYGSRFAPYPHRHLAAVEADFADGMEFDGLYFLGQEYYAAYAGEPSGYLIMLAAHETAHQWWYALAANDQALEPFLDEAFATYSELIFYEHYYPQLAAWWWQYRVERFAPQGCVNSTIYDHASFRPYVNAVYLRGAQLLHELRQALGDEQFGAFLRDYLAGSRTGLATTAAFDRSLRAHFDGDPTSLLQAYCLETHAAPP